jgi:hypothetical protein
MNRGLAVALSFASAVACSPPYAYVPTTNATAVVQGRVAAEYPVPPESPTGDVRIASYGITSVAPRGSGASARALHLRVVLANSGPTAWAFDTREQRLDLSGTGPLAPSFASADTGAPPPLVTVPPAGKRVVDLFFVLPAALQQPGKLPQFDALWRVNVGARVVAERAPFERLIVEPTYGKAWDYGPGYYWGEPYWMNPAFAPGGAYGTGVDIRGWPEYAPGDGYVAPPGEPHP